MNLVDLLVLAIMGVSALLGLSRGLIREVLGLGAWILAGFAAFRLGPGLAPYARDIIGNQDIADPVAYVAAFVVVLIALSLAANLVGRLVRVSALGGVDHTLGLLFGLARGAAILIVAYIPLAQMLPPEKWPDPVLRARTVPFIHDGAVWAADQLPGIYRPRVAPPPDTRPATDADPLHATPDAPPLGPAPAHP